MGQNGIDWKRTNPEWLEWVGMGQKWVKSPWKRKKCLNESQNMSENEREHEREHERQKLDHVCTFVPFVVLLCCFQQRSSVCHVCAAFKCRQPDQAKLLLRKQCEALRTSFQSPLRLVFRVHVGYLSQTSVCRRLSFRLQYLASHSITFWLITFHCSSQ